MYDSSIINRFQVAKTKRTPSTRFMRLQPSFKMLDVKVFGKMPPTRFILLSREMRLTFTVGWIGLCIKHVVEQTQCLLDLQGFNNIF